MSENSVADTELPGATAGEEQIQEVQQNLGEAVVGYIGEDHAIDPLTGGHKPRDEEPATRIEDESAAETMAYAGDGARSEAVTERRLAYKRDKIDSAYETKIDVAEAKQQELQTKGWPPIWRPFARGRREAEHMQVMGDTREAIAQKHDGQLSVWEENYRRRADAQDEIGEPSGDAPSHMFPLMETPEGRAKYYDDKADALETEARILHSHPVSQASKDVGAGEVSAQPANTSSESAGQQPEQS